MAKMKTVNVNIKDSVKIEVGNGSIFLSAYQGRTPNTMNLVYLEPKFPDSIPKTVERTIQFIPYEVELNEGATLYNYVTTVHMSNGLTWNVFAGGPSND